MEIYYSQSNENECYVSKGVRNSYLSFEIDEMLSLKGFEKYTEAKIDENYKYFCFSNKGV